MKKIYRTEAPPIARKEDGSGGISYAMYFIAIIMTATMFAFTTFNADLFVIEQALENGLHLAENIVLTSNQGTVVDSEREDEFERELDRMKIVSESTAEADWGPGEKEQVDALGKLFADSLVEHLSLKDRRYPAGGILEKLCGPDADVLITGDVVIYEPEYELSVTRTANAEAETETDERYATKKWDFDTSYVITDWIQYNLHYSGNVYQGCDKTVLPTKPVLKSKNPVNNADYEVEGATIEASLSVSLKGIKNIFSGVSTTTPTIAADGTPDMSGVNGGLFANTAPRKTYDVLVTQAADIVIAEDDLRDIDN